MVLQTALGPGLKKARLSLAELAEDSEESLFLFFSLTCSLTPEKKGMLSVDSVREEHWVAATLH